MPSPFELVSAVERIEPNTFIANIPDGWQQGRGAFGGLVLGTLARAMIASEPDATRILRLLSGEICGPVLPGPARIEVSLLRRGKNLTNLHARLLQSNEVIAHASAGLSTARNVSATPHAPAPPRATPWQDVGTVDMNNGFAPVFAKHFEYRVTGPFPFTGGDVPLVEGYVREAVVPTRVDAPMVIALLDAYWPALFSIETQPRAAATVGFTAQLLCDPATLDVQTPLLHRARMEALRDGFFVEFRELWHDTTLVAMNQQTFALLT